MRGITLELSVKKEHCSMILEISKVSYESFYRIAGSNSLDVTISLCTIFGVF